MCAACVMCSPPHLSFNQIFPSVTISPDQARESLPHHQQLISNSKQRKLLSSIIIISCWNQSQPLYLSNVKNDHAVKSSLKCWRPQSAHTVGWTACSSPASCLCCISRPCWFVHVSLSQHLCLACQQTALSSHSASVMFDFCLARRSLPAAAAVTAALH